MAAEHGVTPDNDYRILPVFAYLRNDAPHQTEYVQTFVHTAWAQKGKYELTAVTLEDKQRHVATLAIVIIEEGQLLGTVGVAVAVVKVENNPGRNILVGSDELVYELTAHVV